MSENPNFNSNQPGFPQQNDPHGYPQPTQQVVNPADEAARKRAMQLAIASLVLGILSLFVFPIGFGLGAIATGVGSLRMNRGYKGLSIAGIIVGAFGLVLWVLAKFVLHII